MEMKGKEKKCYVCVFVLFSSSSYLLFFMKQKLRDENFFISGCTYVWLSILVENSSKQYKNPVALADEDEETETRDRERERKRERDGMENFRYGCPISSRGTYVHKKLYLAPNAGSVEMATL